MKKTIVREVKGLNNKYKKLSFNYMDLKRVHVSLSLNE